MKKKHGFKVLWQGALGGLLLPLFSIGAAADDPTSATNVGGANFANSDIATGTANLLSDVSSWLVGIGLTVGTLAAVYCLIRKSMADEVDGKMWNKRLVTAIICAVAVALVGGIIALISSYYGG